MSPLHEVQNHANYGDRIETNGSPWKEGGID